MSEYTEENHERPEEPFSAPVRKARHWMKWSALALFGGGIILNFAGDHFHRKDLYRKSRAQEQRVGELDHRIQELEKQKQALAQRLDADSKATSESINGAIGTLRELRDLFDGKE